MYDVKPDPIRQRPLVSAAGGSRADRLDGFPGERIRLRVDSRDAGGRFNMVESVAQPGSGPPLHRHREDETFLVLEGTLTFQCGAERFEASAGTVVMIPGGTAHGWFNFGDAPTRAVITFSPGGNEEMLVSLGRVPPDELEDYAAWHGVELLGPPLGDALSGGSPDEEAAEAVPALQDVLISAAAALFCAALIVLFVLLALAPPAAKGTRTEPSPRLAARPAFVPRSGLS